MGGCAGKSCSSDGPGTGMEGNLGSNFAGDREEHLRGRNGEDREREQAQARIPLGWLDARTYRTIRTCRPGSTGRGSCGRFPEEAGYQSSGPPTGAEGSTAWRRQGKAAEGRDSNKRPVGGSMPWVAQFHPLAGTPVPAGEVVDLGLEFRTSGTGGRY